MKIPGGNAPLYYANNLIKFVSSTKYVEEKDGFDGFLIRAELLKSRTNKAGQSVELIYTQSHGFDPFRTLYHLADENGLIEGRNPYRYVKGHPEFKFDSRKFADISTNDEFRRILVDAVMPMLQSYLGETSSEFTNSKEDAENYMNNILPSLFDE